MTIRNQLSRRLLGLVALVLGLVLLVVYGLVNRQREAFFHQRLQQGAEARGVLWMESSPGAAMGSLRSNSSEFPELPTVLWIYNYQNKLLWNEDSIGQLAPLSPSELDKARRDGVAFFRRGAVELAAVAFAPNRYNRMMVVWGCEDAEGQRQLEFLRWILVAGWVLGLVLTGLFSYWFSGKALSPLSHLLDRVEGMQTSKALGFHLVEADRPDEIGRLARKFNEFMDRLSESVRSQQKFLGLASHQLRTPLASTKASLEVLLRKNRTEDEYRSALAKTLLSLEELNRTAHRLLTWVQLDAGAHTMLRTEVSLDELLVEIQATWQRHLPHWEIHCLMMTGEEEGRPISEIPTKASGADLFKVRGDSELLRTAIDNLIENAVKYSDQPRLNLELVWREQDRMVRLSVQDYGRGMDQETMKRIYEPFYRANHSMDRTGHGLGLALVHQIVQWHGGAIHVDSEPGQGSTFSIDLPPIFGHA
jgi:signal transduction histidine kinase